MEDLTKQLITTPYDLSGGAKVFEITGIGKASSVEITIEGLAIAGGTDGELLAESAGENGVYNWADDSESESIIIMDALGDNNFTFRFVDFSADSVKLTFTPNAVTGGTFNTIEATIKYQQ